MIHCRAELKIRVCHRTKELARQHFEDCNATRDQLYDNRLDSDEDSMTNSGRGIEVLSRGTLSLSLTLVSFRNLRNEFRHEGHLARSKQQVQWQWLKLSKWN